jgi:diguanylate cyclase (GGDEF)-like protein
MQKERQGLDHSRLRRSTDADTSRKRNKRHTVPLLEKLAGDPSSNDSHIEAAGRKKTRITNPFRRQNRVLHNLISLLAPECPTSLLSAYRYYFESSLVKPHHFTSYSRINGNLRGQVRIENIEGQSTISSHEGNISITDDPIVQAALENNAVYLIHKDKMFSIGKSAGAKIREERLPVRSALSRMVIPLDSMCGLIDIVGEDLTFGLFGRSSGLRVARTFSNLVSLKLKSEIDPLTGLLNRRGFDNGFKYYLSAYLQNGRNTSLVMLDVDHFKSVNDRHGHPNGDRVLASCASTALFSFRESDLLGAEKKGMVARHGGEEFAVLLPDTDSGDAIRAAERCREAIKSNAIRMANGENISVTVSMGIVSFKDAEQALNSGDQGVVIFPESERGRLIEEKTISLADDALYFAKNSGRDLAALAIPNEVGQVEFAPYQF